MPRLLLLVCLLPLAALSLAAADPVRLTGANGREVTFAGIWEARPEGLAVVADAESPLIVIPWARLDLERLTKEHPGIANARNRAVFLQRNQPLNLGLFEGLRSPSQLGAELRRILDTRITVKVPLVYRTTTKTSTKTTIAPVYPEIYDGIIILPPEGAASVNRRTVTEVETRQVTPEELSTTPRRVLEMLSRDEGISPSDRMAIFELAKTNTSLLVDPAHELDLLRAALPPRRLLENDPTLQTLSRRLELAADNLREISTSIIIQYEQRQRIRDFLWMVEDPVLR